MAGNDHEPLFPDPEEGGPCWCGGEGFLELVPAGYCVCGHPGAMPPCWACENSLFRCAECYCQIDEVDWPILALGHVKIDG